MDSINLGPFAISTSLAFLLGAPIVGSLVARLVWRSRDVNIESLLWRGLIFGVVIARAVYIIAHFDSYKNSPWKMLDLRDGGFLAAAGVAAVVAFIVWQAMRSTVARKPLLFSALAGTSFWAIGMVVTSGYFSQPQHIPDLELTRLDGAPVQLRSLSGKPIIVNFWATWCPPCQREMPVLRDAQARHRDITFVFVNQGESNDEIRSFLASEGLTLENVIVDPRLQFARQFDSKALPTTLFFDEQGLLTGRRMGELSPATLDERIELLRQGNSGMIRKTAWITGRSGKAIEQNHNLDVAETSADPIGTKVLKNMEAIK